MQNTKVGSFSPFLLDRASKVDPVKSSIDIKNIIMIHGGPGQGKTEFAKKVGEVCFDKVIYYQVTEPDRDPVHFCISLHTLFASFSHKYSCPDFDTVISSGKLEAYDSENYIKMIIKSLRKNLMKRTVVILDDLNMLPDIGLACMTVLTAVSSSGGLLSFILSSQNNCHFPEKFSKLNKTVFLIDNDYLSISEAEFKELCVNMLDEACSFSGLEQIYQITEGWTAGVIKILENIAPCRKEMLKTEFFVSLFDDYFHKYTDGYNKKNFSFLYLLSILDDFDCEFVGKIDPSGKTAGILQDMLTRNIFVSINNTTIRFNRLFREWMRLRAHKMFSKKEINELYLGMHEFELSRNNVVKSLESLILSKSYAKLEDFVSKNYYAITSTEYSKHLHGSFSAIPAEELSKNPWTAILLSTVLTINSNERTLEMFLAAYGVFEMQDRKDGMLAASCGLVCTYCTVEGDVDKAAIYFEVLDRLKNELMLHDAAFIQVHLAYALGCLYLDDSRKALESLDKAMSIAQQTGLTSIMIRIYAAYVMTYLSLCDREMADKYCDAMVLKLNTSALNYPQKMFIIHHLIYYASINGMFGMMNVFVDIVKRKSRVLTELDGRVGVFIAMSESDFFLAKNRPEEALRVINSYSDNRIKSMPPHRGSFIYAIKALISAYGCDYVAAEYAEKAVRLRESMTCNPFYISITNYLAGAVYTLLSNHKKAEYYLMKNIDSSESELNPNACASSYAYLSYLYNNIGDRLKARENAISALKMFRRTGYSRYMGMLPEVMLNACAYAVTDASIGSYAAELAYSQYDTAFDEYGKYITVMRVNTLDGLSLDIGGKVMDCSDISVNFRTLLAVLLSSGGYNVEQELLQTYIWPESGKEQARKSFDNLVSRFRKMLSDFFAGIDPKNYIVMNNGILRLKNVKCDADVFLQLSKSARDRYSRGEYTSAVESLINAEKLFKNRFFVNISSVVSVSQKRREVDAAFLSMLKTMQRVGFFLPDVFAPERFFNQWLDTFMSETEMVAMAFKYYNQAGRHQKCREIIRDFTMFLRQDGYTEEEISELIFIVKTAI